MLIKVERTPGHHLRRVIADSITLAQVLDTPNTPETLRRLPPFERVVDDSKELLVTFEAYGVTI